MEPKPLKKAFTFTKGVVRPENAEVEEEGEEDEDMETGAVITVDTLMIQYNKWISMRRWAYILLFISEVVGLVCVAWPASLQLESGEGLGGLSDLRELQTVRDGLVYYDEVLTMSARMCALSGRPEFAGRYDETVGPLEANIARVLELRPEEADTFNEATVVANDELIRLETLGLLGCSEGSDRIPTAEAVEAVMGVEYELNKGSYVYGILTLKTGIDTYLLKQKELDWQSTMFLWLVGIIVMLLLGATQTAQQAQDEESVRLAAEFEYQIDSLNDAQLVMQQMESMRSAHMNSTPKTQGDVGEEAVGDKNDVVGFGETDDKGDNGGLVSMNVHATYGSAPSPINVGVTEAWGASGQMTSVDGAKVHSSTKRKGSGFRSTKAPMAKTHQGCCSQLLEALSVQDFFVKAPRLKRRERSYRFLRGWMPMVVFISNVIALGCVLSPPFIQMETEEMVRMGHTLRELSELVGQIKYYDEVLTGSARMCALTGDIRWMSRYLSNVGHIDAAINSVVSRIGEVSAKYPEIRDRFGGVNLGDFFLETTDAANRRLIELEDAVIVNCTHAALYHRDDLFTDEYKTNKVVLLEGLDKLSNDVIVNVEEQENANLKTVSVSYFYIVISLIAFRGFSGLLFVYYCIRINWLEDKIKIHNIKNVVQESLNKEQSPAT